EHVPERTAPAAERLLAAGAVLVGKASLPEFAWNVTGQNPSYGTAHNPVQPARTTGGSSSGNAAALAAGPCGPRLGTVTREPRGRGIRRPARAARRPGRPGRDPRAPREHLAAVLPRGGGIAPRHVPRAGRRVQRQLSAQARAGAEGGAGRGRGRLPRGRGM